MDEGFKRLILAAELRMELGARKGELTQVEKLGEREGRLGYCHRSLHLGLACLPHAEYTPHPVTVNLAMGLALAQEV